LFEEMALPDRAWIDYERDGDEEVLAIRHALFFGSIFMHLHHPSKGYAWATVRRSVFSQTILRIV
jgi:hypothetical protein